MPPRSFRLLLIAIFSLGLLGSPVAENDDADVPRVREREAVHEQATNAFAKQDWNQAQHLYNRILEHEPRNPLILANLGSVEYQLDDLKACTQYLEMALALKNDLHASREMLGMAYYQDKQPYRALAALARAVGDQPKEARAHNQLAVVLQAMKWFDGAESSLKTAVQLDPEYLDAHYNLALFYLDTEPRRLKLARKHYEIAKQLGMASSELMEKRLK